METATATPETPATPKPVKKKAAPKPRAAKKKDFLPKPCRQVLGTLAKASGPMTRRAIADKVGKTDTLIEGRISTETKTYAFLLESKFIKERTYEIEEDVKETGYEILAAGRAAYDRAIAALKQREANAKAKEKASKNKGKKKK